MSSNAPAEPSSAHSEAARSADRSENRMDPEIRLVVALLVVSAFVVVLNETIMSVALPRLMEDLSITASTAQWLTTAFMLTMAVVIPITGYLLQRFNLRPVFIAAMSLFSLGTLVAALAPGFAMLLAGRIIQASGTAIMMPLLMTTIMNVVPADRRGRMMGTISIVIAVAPAIGPTISGIILNALDWRWMFWLVLPIALLSLAVGASMIRNVTETRRTPLDVLSVALSAFAFGGLVFGLSSIGEGAEGEAVVEPWVPVVVGLIALAIFIARQVVLARDDKALLDLRTFATPTFSIAIVVVVISMMALFGTIILLPIFLQNVVGLDTLQTGLLMLPGGAAMAITSPIAGRLFDSFGPRPLVVPGAILMSASLWVLAGISDEATVPMLIAVHVALHIGLAFIFTPLLTSALGSLPVKLYSHGSATVGTIQQLAGAFGAALFITLYSTQSQAALADGLTGADAMSQGVQAAFGVGAAISVVAVLASLFVKRPAPEPLANTHATPSGH